jgi:prephenate dehydratase
MTLSIAHLGPAGTNAEAAAFLYASGLQAQGQRSLLCSYPSITQSLQAVAEGKADLVVVPVENSVEGSVTTTLDALWQLDTLQIQSALILPISYAFFSQAPTIEAVQTVYSHPQALAQCQHWLEKHLPSAQLIPTNSTTEALHHLSDDPTVGALSAERAAQLYNLPILACPINDYPDNCTRFWVLGLQPSPGGTHTSLGFSVRDTPGALVRPLQVFADRQLNLSRIESRPTKRSLGEYVFFLDLETDARSADLQSALEEVAPYAETLKVFGSYSVLPQVSQLK